MTDTYRPGTCNIGEAEIARRRRTAVGLTIAAVVAGGMLVASGLPVPARVLLFPVAAAAAVTWLQVVRRFCVAFGALGVRNFGALGTTDAIEDREARSADRRTALRMVLEGVAYGAVITGAVMLIPA